MKFFKYSLIFIFFIGISCQDVKYMKRPENLISEDKMVDILTEMVLVNSARNYNKIMLEQTGLKPDAYIYEKFDIDSLQFEKSNAYYSENYDVYDVIYEKVKDSLQGLKSKYDKLAEAESKKKDSINKQKLDRNRPGFKKQKIDSTKVDSLKLDSIARRREDNLKSQGLRSVD